MHMTLTEGPAFIAGSLKEDLQPSRPAITSRSRATYPVALDLTSSFNSITGDRRAGWVHPCTPRDALAASLAGVAHGDIQAFERVYAATSARVYGIVVRLVGRRDIADEILQEVYLRVWLRAAEFDPMRGSPITWLATIARNRALDEVKRKACTTLDDCPEALQVASGDDPIADREQEERWLRLQASMDRLEPEKRKLVLLVYHHGMTREEIAHRVGRPVSTIKTLLRRALNQMKADLDETQTL